MRKTLFTTPSPGIYPLYADKPASNEFKNIVCDGSSPTLDCELCNRTHFDETGECMEKVELENLLKKQEADPEKYCCMDGQVHGGMIEGMQVVINCPCNGLRLYEDFIMQSRHLICEYLLEATQTNLFHAQNDADLASKVSKAVEKT